MPAASRRRVLLAGVLAAALLVPAVRAPAQGDAEHAVQGPRTDWRVLTTPHFRVHYPRASEAWTRHVAARLESIRERVAAEVGYAPPETVDVVVSDPVAETNGFALPILGWPRLVLWTRPPGAASVLGHYRDWAELLAVHEETHLVHLLRPSRNPWRRALGRLVPVAPIARAAPRWVSEGYATLIEGRLTGAGRPGSDLRAAVLRRWAMAGRLPTYGALAADRDDYLGMSMAYLAGSAYLAWLEERAGEGSLRHLWARMTARRRRDFATAFRGVFGEAPDVLYARFTAELTWRAVEAERRIAAAGPDGGWAEGEPWADLDWDAGAPALSPDGERLAVALRHRDDPSELVIFATAVDAEEVAELGRERERLLAADPEDVAPVETGPPPHERLEVLPELDGVPATSPRWLPDGRLLVVREMPDAAGFLHPDLFVWAPQEGRLDRITRGADLDAPDPAPGGDWAVAVRSRDGTTQLVRVDLATGAVAALTPPAVTTVVDHPRLDADGRRLVYARHAAGDRWALVVRDLADGSEEELPAPPGATLASPAWGRGATAGTVFATAGRDGFVDVVAWTPWPDGWSRRRLTRSRGAALAPEPGAGELFFLSLGPDGLDLRRLDLPAAGAAAPAAATRAAVDELADLAPVVTPPEGAPPAPFAVADVGPGHAAGLGRQELLPLVGGAVGPAGDRFAVGLRGGDLLGRLDWVVGGCVGGSTARGGSAAATWRGPTPGPPLALTLQLFERRELPSRQPETVPGLGTALDVTRAGAELAAAWQRERASGDLRLGGGLYAGTAEPRAPQAGGRRGERSLFAEAGWQPWAGRGDRWAGLDLALRGDAGESGGDGWSRLRGRLGVEVGAGDSSLGLTWSGGRLDGADAPAWQRFQLGGVASGLLPSTVAAPRVWMPALPAGTLRGDRFGALRADLDLAWLPVPLFWARYDFAGAAPLEVGGVEIARRVGPVPLVRLPEVALTVGLARILDPPFRGDTTWWLGLAWSP